MTKKIIYLLLTVSILFGFASALVSQEPSVSITADKIEGQAPLTVNFTADVTDPFEGKHPVTYDWIFGDNTASTKKAPGHTFSDAGTYTVVCKVTFWKSPKVTVEDSIEINVISPPPLEVSIEADPISGPVSLSVSFTSTVSGGTDAGVTYAWDFGDEAVSAEANPTHIFNTLGTYNVTCTVTDTVNSSLTAQAGIEINVSPPPLAVSIDAEPTSGPAPLTVKFTCTVSGGTDAVDTYAWDFGDEATSAEANPSHIFNSPGTYNVNCTVTDTSTPPTTAQAGIEITVTQLWPAAVCTSTGNQADPQITTDGSNGAIITWQDDRGGTSNVDIYAHRISSTGEALWTDNGVAVSKAYRNQYVPQIISDGSGGAVITWFDNRSANYDIYAQRIDNTGKTLWTQDGEPVCIMANAQQFPQITSDGSGGVVFTWQDSRSGTIDNIDIYAQRMTNDGKIQWPVNGVAICTAASSQQYPQITTDGSGGTIITWQDYRGGNYGSKYDIYAQRINSAGVIQWAANGVAVCTAADNQMSPHLVSDGSGGAVITWYDNRGGNYDIYAQRINSAGELHWTVNGVVVSSADDFQSTPQIISDGSGGAVITWYDNRGGNNDIYAQRINSEGKIQWTADGLPVCTDVQGQNKPQITTDGSGGAIITWQDSRNLYNDDIYAQRINSVGVIQWKVDGVAVCSAINTQSAPQITSDGSGGAIITWLDYRNGNPDIYAQRIAKDGELLK